MPNLSQRYILALSELSQFQCASPQPGLLTHLLTGVQVAAEDSTEGASEAALLRLTFCGGHRTVVAGRLYLELQLAEHAAHRMHSVSDEGTGEIHKRAARLWEELQQKHALGA